MSELQIEEYIVIISILSKPEKFTFDNNFTIIKAYTVCLGV